MGRSQKNEVGNGGVIKSLTLVTLLFSLAFGFSKYTFANTLATSAIVPSAQSCIVEATIDGAIGPASLDFLERTSNQAKISKCGAILLLINTPGGSLQTTRLMVEHILNSPVPIMCLIYPSGAHAGSAGAIIMQACHVSGAMEATNIGAATPISSSGEKMPDDLRKKLINDTRSWVEGLAKLRGRSAEFAKEIVEDAKALSAAEALKAKAIDVVVKTKEEFLSFADKKEVALSENQKTTIVIGETIVMVQDLRYRIMDVLMNPQVAYLMFMGSLGLLYFELTHPGMIAPGVIGGVGLIISLISLHMLDVTWGAVLLILAGIGFMIAEAFVAGFGVLGIGGVISFFIGSLFLFDPAQTGLVLPLSTILPTTLLVGLLMIGVAYLAFSSRKRRPRGGYDDLIGEIATVSSLQDGDAKFG
ncbi:MAG: nodulation protein NfeD, partial [Bdellovibrionales bacterium]|nr:nodulation protein NfeD [Bdellovibrionales bacterium]